MLTSLEWQSPFALVPWKGLASSGGERLSHESNLCTAFVDLAHRSNSILQHRSRTDLSHVEHLLPLVTNSYDLLLASQQTLSDWPCHLSRHQLFGARFHQFSKRPHFNSQTRAHVRDVWRNSSMASSLCQIEPVLSHRLEGRICRGNAAGTG